VFIVNVSCRNIMRGCQLREKSAAFAIVGVKFEFIANG